MRQQINLIDPTLLPKVERFSSKTMLLLVAVATAVLGVHYAYERWQLNKTMASAKAQESSTAQANPEEPVTTDPVIDGRRRAIVRDESLRDGLAKLTDLPIDNATLLASVIAALPNNLWLKEVDFISKGGLRIVGGAMSPVALADYADKLAHVPALSGLPVQVVTVEPEAAVVTQVSASGPDADAPELHDKILVPPHFTFVLATATARGVTP